MEVEEEIEEGKGCEGGGEVGVSLLTCIGVEVNHTDVAFEEHVVVGENQAEVALEELAVHLEMVVVMVMDHHTPHCK